ncbi:adenylate kinase family protein [Vulcanisaeta souniana]|uniref:Kinase n=1 Tax=Vulcanisaeta souniana JCM 11219 TaxID=1293586 RepID=A0A830E3T6_9CREN|nr:AAA family ATPase [Vulcanisaeta souniana]BDR91014.1 kinase [Vulcanisaeta souniana JCM 11219]GGI80012.1 kinase [Vulcanisaeta souniana JCM 11219]
MVRLVVTGTPGVGKTTVAIELSKAYDAPVVDINEIIRPVLKWDPELQTSLVIDEVKARELIREDLGGAGSYIIDTVAINLIDKSLIDWCIVLRLDPRQVMDRLLKRNWPRCKIVENVLAEVVGSPLNLAIDVFGRDRVIEVDTTNKDAHEVANHIVNQLTVGVPVIGVVDWLDTLDTDFILNLSRELDDCLAQ